MATKTQIKKFIATIAPLAQTEYKRRKAAGEDWVLPSVCIGQAALETGWGTSSKMVIANAIFGIKWTEGCGYKAYSSATKEVYDGETVTIAGVLFRAYESLQESVADYYKLICEKICYKSARNIADANVAIAEIIKCGYATDPDYVSSVQKIIKQHNLTQYDDVEVKTTTTTKAENAKTTPKHKIGDKVTYKKIYVSADSTKPLRPAKTSGVITKVLADKAHPYLIDRETGWIDDSCIVSDTAVSKTSGVTTIKSTIKEGDKVKVVKAIDYDTGKSFKTWYEKYDVLDVKGNRAVIGIGKTVTSAIHIDNITKV